MRRSLNHRGQGMSEMLIVMPLLISILGGGMFFVYTAWQGIKVQQAANLAARIQGQERVSGGTSPENIEHENGTGIGAGDPDPAASGASPNQKFNGSPSPVPNTSVFGKYYEAVKDNFFPNAKKT